MVIGETVQAAWVTKVGRTQPADMLRASDTSSFAALRSASIGPGERDAMQRKGAEIISKNPALSSQHANIQAASPDAARGFRYAVGTLASGDYSQAMMRENLETGASYGVIPPTVNRAQQAEVVRGFDAGAIAFRGGPALVQGPALPSGASEGIPRAAIIAGGAVLVAGAAFAIIKLRK